jgi:hypothetical protein
VDSIRPLSKTSAIVVLLNKTETVRCMVVVRAEEGITSSMCQVTYIDVEGVISLAPPNGWRFR